MTLVNVLILLIVAGICGAVGQALAGSIRGGILVSIALGFVGALLGTYLARALHLPELLTVAGLPIVWSIIGAALFVALLAFLSRSRL